MSDSQPKRLPPPVLLAGALAALVALGSAILSWDALMWAAGEFRIDPHLRLIFPIVVDGVTGVATVGALATRSSPRRVRAYWWAMLAGAVSVSVWSNGAHSYDGVLIHAGGGALPSVGLVVTLHGLVVLGRHVRGAPAPRTVPRTVQQPEPGARGAPRRAARRAAPRVELPSGQAVHPATARKLRARERREGGVPDAA